MAGLTSKHAVPAILAGAVMISFSGVWVKLAHVSPTASAFYRVFFGSLLLLPTVLVRRELSRKSFRQYSIAALSAAFFAADLFFWHKSILYIGPGLATIIANFQVFGMALVGILFFSEKLRPAFIFSLPLAMAGLYLIIGVNWGSLGPEYGAGIGFGFATAACYLGYLLTLRMLQSEKEDASPFFFMMLVTSISSLFLGGMMVASGDSFAIPDLQSFLSLGALGLFSQLVGWVMIANAMPHIRASHTGLILLLQPALSFVWDVLFFARPTDLLNWTGVIMALAAIYLGMMQKKD